MPDIFSFWPGNNTCGKNILRINEFCLELEATSLLQTPTSITYQTTECEECDALQLGVILPNTTRQFVLNTNFPIQFQLGDVCNVTKWFDDFGLYHWKIGSYNATDCEHIDIKKTPEYFWVNFATVGFACILIPLLLKILKFCWKRNCIQKLFHRNLNTFEELQNDAPESNNHRNEARPLQMTRVTTIDVFRGLSIALMVFVNYGGGQYSVFKHAPWNGLTVADVVFPFFIWIMGVSTVISLRSQLRAVIDRKKIFFKIVRRSIILISLGIILNSGKINSPLRIPGVLQRIGLTYFFIASIELFFGKPQRSDRYGPWNMCVEVVDAKLQWVFILILTAIQISITFLLPVPDCPTGYLGPGGAADHGLYENCTGGAAGYIDRVIFTTSHIYQNPTSSKIYHSHVPYDPEGLLGVCTSIVMAFFGANCGRIILSYEGSKSRLLRWIFWSIAMGMAAGFLCGWSKSDGVIPINKNLWSISYVLATSSMAFLLFALLYWLIDDMKFWVGAPFLYAGMNSIAIYLGHELLNKQLPWRWTPLTNTHIELLIMDVSATAFWLILSYIMFMKNIFFTL